MIKHNLSQTTLFKPLLELFVELGVTNLPYILQEKKTNTSSHRTVGEFRDCQANVVIEYIEDKMKSADGYGLMLHYRLH